MKETVSQRLKKLRTEQKITIEKVASAIRVSRSTYWEWENGRSIKGEEAYILLARLYDVSVYYILTGEKLEAFEVLDKMVGLEKKLKDLRFELREYLAMTTNLVKK